MRKSYRVKKEQEFQRVFHHGNSVANRQFVVYQIDKSNQSHFRVGISVSKKLGNAVVRNRIKRLIRSVLTELKPQLQSEIDFIVIARKPVVSMNYQEVKKCMMHVLKLGNDCRQGFYMYKGRHTKQLVCDKFGLKFNDINLLLL